jgi:hypothetical protein
VRLALRADEPLRRSDWLRFLIDPVALLAFALALSGLAGAWDLGRRSPGLDFYQFWVVAQVAGRGDVPNVYDAEARTRIGAEFVRRSLTDEDSERRRVAARPWQVLEPTATPLLYSVFRPISGGSYEAGHALFRLASLVALTAGVLTLARLVGHGATLALLLLALVTHAFQPLEADIRVGNVNQLQLGGIAVYLWLSSRPDRSRLQIAAGALLAAMVLFKPNLLPLVPLLLACWLLRRRRGKLARQALGMALGTPCGLALGGYVFGTLQAWSDWWAYLSSLPPAKIPLRYGNIGLARLLLETLDVDLAPLLALATTGLVLFCLWLGRRRDVPPPAGPDPAATIEDTAALGAGCLVYLLSAPMVWLHYLLLALPAVSLLLRREVPGHQDARAASWRRGLVVVALLGIAVDPLAQALGIQRLRDQAVLTTLALLLVFVLLCREIASWSRPPRASC